VRVRLVHRNGEVKSVEAGLTGNDLHIYWPIAGWYHVYTSSGRIAGAKSWRVHPDDMQKLVAARPKRPRKRRSVLT
jgi:hypothetical protein